MKTTPALLSALFALVCQVHAAPVPLFDGKTFDGWEGDIDTVWRIGDGAFVAGSLEKKQAKNNFLATRKDYADFELTLKWKLEGTKGFVNGGVHGQRPARHPALAGQAGDPADILLLGAFAQGFELDETDECGYAIGYWSHRPPPSPRLHPLSCHQTPGQSLLPAKRLRSSHELPKNSPPIHRKLWTNRANHSFLWLNNVRRHANAFSTPGVFNLAACGL
jgi:hypothetical protein